MLYTNSIWMEGITLKALIDRDLLNAKVYVPSMSILLEIDKKLIRNYERVEEVFKTAYSGEESRKEESEGCKVFLFEERLILLARQDVEKLTKIVL